MEAILLIIKSDIRLFPIIINMLMKIITTPIKNIFSNPNQKLPISAKNVSARKSVSLSAKIIDALFDIGSPLTSLSKNDFITSPILPGDALITNPERNIFNDIFFEILMPSSLR